MAYNASANMSGANRKTDRIGKLRNTENRGKSFGVSNAGSAQGSTESQQDSADLEQWGMNHNVSQPG